MGSVYQLTLRQLAGRWRIIIMLVLASMPVVIAVMLTHSPHAGSLADFETAIIGAMLSGAIAPLVVLALAAPAFANEIEDRTLANLTLSPIPRWKIVLPKLLASITLAGPFIALSAFLTSYITFLGDARAVVAVTVSALVGVAVYSSAFLWLGLVSTQAIGAGLLYIVVWEGFFSGFVSGVRLLSIRHHAIALVHALDARRFAQGDHLSLTAVAATSSVLFFGFLWLSVRRLRMLDVP